MTLAAFVAALVGMTVPGVKRVAAGPPSQMGAADLPLLFPRLPTQDGSFTALGGTGTGVEATVELVIVVAPYGLDTRGQTFATAVALTDALNTALAGLAGNTVDRWAVRVGSESFDEGATGYTVLVAAVEGSW